MAALFPWGIISKRNAGLLAAAGERKFRNDNKEKIGKRVQYHRNAFAHGNIEMKIDSNILLDLNVLQWLILCIVLDTIGFEKNGIKKIIHYFRDGNIHLAQSICDHYDGNEKQA